MTRRKTKYEQWALFLSANSDNHYNFVGELTRLPLKVIYEKIGISDTWDANKFVKLRFLEAGWVWSADYQRFIPVDKTHDVYKHRLVISELIQDDEVTLREINSWLSDTNFDSEWIINLIQEESKQ